MEAAATLSITGPESPTAGDELLFTATLTPTASSVHYTWTLDGVEVDDNYGATLRLTADEATTLHVGCTALANGTTETAADPLAVDVADRPPPPATVAIIPPADPILAGAGLAFAATVDPPAGPRTVYRWDFGDATESAEPAPVHAYASSGSYTVRLTVGDDATADCALAVVAAPTPVDLQAQVAAVCSYVQGRVQAIRAADLRAEDEPQQMLYRTVLAWLEYEQGNLEAALGAERAVTEPHIPEAADAEVEVEAPESEGTAEASAEEEEPAPTTRRRR
jgi:hypothetical protein